MAKDTHKTKDGRTAKKGLWYNIAMKKKRGRGSLRIPLTSSGLNQSGVNFPTS